MATGNSPGTHGNWIYLMHPITGLSTLGMSVSVKPKHKDLDGFIPGSVPRAAQGWPPKLTDPFCILSWGHFSLLSSRSVCAQPQHSSVSPVCGTLLKSCKRVMCHGQVSQGSQGLGSVQP